MRASVRVRGSGREGERDREPHLLDFAELPRRFSVAVKVDVQAIILPLVEAAIQAVVESVVHRFEGFQCHSLRVAAV